MGSYAPNPHDTRPVRLAEHIVELLKAIEGYDSPYVDADHLDNVVIDGYVDLLDLATDILEWVKVND